MNVRPPGETPKRNSPPADPGIAPGTWLLLTLAVGAAFARVLDCGFVNYDDPQYYTENARVLAGMRWSGISWALTSNATGNWHPLTWMSLMLDAQCFGMRAWGPHLVNLVLHVVNTLLVFNLFRRLTGAYWRSLFVAALFGLHPLRVESVAWVSERKDVLCACFFLLSLRAYAHYAEQRVSRQRRWPALVLAMVFFALSLLSKPMAVTLPALLLLLDYWPLGRFKFTGAAGAGSGLRKLVSEKIGFVVLGALAGWFTLNAQRHGGTVVSAASLPLGWRMENAVVAYGRYVAKTLWPDQLAVFYPHPGRWPLSAVVFAGVLLLVVSACSIRFGRTRPWLRMGWLWFLVMLVPVIGLVQAGGQSLADRYTYLPQIGLLVIISWGAAESLRRFPALKSPAMAAAGLYAVVLGICTWIQCGYWRNSESLFRHALLVTPDNPVARNHLGYALEQQGKFDQALAEYQRAVSLSPEDGPGLGNVGNVLATRGELDEAVRWYLPALEHDPENPRVLQNLGIVNARLGRTNEAVGFLRASLKLEPDRASARLALAQMLAGQGQWREAETEFAEMLLANPRDAEIWIAFGSVLTQQGRVAEAQAAFQKSLALAPDSGPAAAGLAFLLARSGKLQEALPYFRKAVELQPADAGARFNLAGALQAGRQADEAITNLMEAVRLDPQFAGARMNLGGLLAERGRYDEAVAQLQFVAAASPASADAHFNLARVLEMQGQRAKALAHYQQAHSLRASTSTAQAIAWLLATAPEAELRNGPEAVRLAEQAARATNQQDISVLDAWAAALAETGMWTDAVKVGQQAVELAGSSNHADRAAAIRERVGLYLNQQAFRTH